MKHYKLIEWDNVPVDKLLEIIPISKETVKTYVDPIDKDIEAQIASLLNLDLTVCTMHRIMLVYMPAKEEINIHSDKPVQTTEPGKLDQAVFLPLKSCDQLHWNWYEATDPSGVYTHGSNSWKTVPMLHKQFSKLVDTTTGDKPFIADIGTWHNLVNLSDKPAVALSIRLMPWAWQSSTCCRSNIKMKHPNFWHKTIPCADYEQINKELSAWGSAQISDLVDRGIGFEHTDLTDFESAVPTLHTWLNSIKCWPLKNVALVVIGPHKSQSIHIDAQEKDFALNFGVQVKGTYTNMFRIIEGQPITIPYGNQGLVYHSYEHCTLEKETQFILDDAPVLFNTKHVHQVINPTDIPRVAVSLRFYVDPTHLLNH
jgi:hypothetical protein